VYEVVGVRACAGSMTRHALFTISASVANSISSSKVDANDGWLGLIRILLFVPLCVAISLEGPIRRRCHGGGAAQRSDCVYMRTN